MGVPHPSRRAWPRALTLLAVLTVVFGADAPDRYKGMFWTRALWTQALHATISPQAFQIWWAHQFNAHAAAARSKYRVWTLSCKPDGEAVYRCTILLHVAPHGYGCVNAAIGTSGQILAAANVKCPEAALEAAGIAQAAAPKA